MTGSGGEEPVSVYVWADYACPFSYLGHARLRRLREEVTLRDYWRPYPLRDAVPADGLPVDQLGYSPDEWRDVERQVTEAAEEMGLPLEMPGFAANTHEALQAAEFAKDLGREVFERYHEAAFRAYFVENRNLGRREVVVGLADAAGMDPGALEEALDDGRYEDELRRARSEASRYGVTGTPTFLFGRHKVVGAAPAEVLREAWEKARADDPAAAGSGPGPDERAGEG